MKLVAMETSTAVLRLAAFEDGALLEEASVEAPMRQNENLAPLFKALLERRAWKAAELDAVAISLGPGSFSGLRSGLAFAKGLAYATDASLIGVPTLEAWAEDAGGENVLVWLDARNSQVYRGYYSRGLAAVPEAMLSLKEAEAEVFAGCIHVGDVKGLGGFCSAAAVGRLALKRLKPGEKDGPEFVAGLEPIYLRRAEAELLWEKRHV